MVCLWAVNRDFLLLLQMLGRNPGTPAPPPAALHLGLIAVVMGSSLHLVADSVTRRLLLRDYQLHLSVRENPLMKQFKDSPLVGAAVRTVDILASWSLHARNLADLSQHQVFLNSLLILCPLYLHFNWILWFRFIAYSLGWQNKFKINPPIEKIIQQILSACI